jgi:hypothetical protein
MAVTLIDPGELRGKLSSKKDWYCFLKYNSEATTLYNPL